MSALSIFIPYLRTITSDDDPDVQFVEDYQFYQAMRTALAMGKVPGYANADGNTITPDLDEVSDPDAFARLIYQAAKPLVTKLSNAMNWRTRAFSHGVADNRQHIFELVADLYLHEDGAMCKTSEF